MTVRYRLGAEELIELGDSENQIILRNRKPFLAGRLRESASLGTPPSPMSTVDALSIVSKEIADRLTLALSTMASVMNMQLGSLAQSPEIAAKAAAGLLDSCPTTAKLYAQILLFGGTLAKYGLSVPDLGLQGLSTILAGLKMAVVQKLSAQEIDAFFREALEEILVKTSDQNRMAMQIALDSLGASGSNPTPSVSESGQPMVSPAGTSGPAPGTSQKGAPGIETALAVGTVGVVALVTALVGGK